LKEELTCKLWSQCWDSSIHAQRFGQQWPKYV